MCLYCIVHGFPNSLNARHMYTHINTTTQREAYGLNTMISKNLGLISLAQTIRGANFIIN